MFQLGHIIGLVLLASGAYRYRKRRIPCLLFSLWAAGALVYTLMS